MQINLPKALADPQSRFRSVWERPRLIGVEVGNEFARNAHRWSLLFWGFAFVPLFTLTVALVLQANSLHVPGAELHIDVPARLGLALERSGSPFGQVFYIAAAALIFARRDRSPTDAPGAAGANLLRPKILLLISGTVLSLLLVLVGACCTAVLASVHLRAPLLWQLHDASPALGLLLQFSVSTLQLITLGLLSGFCVNFCGSALIGAAAVIVIATGQALLASVVSMRGASWLSFLALPAFCVEVMRFYAAHREFSPHRYVSHKEAAVALLSLLSWLSAAAWTARAKFPRNRLADPRTEL
jgi:hypothetical protein